MSPLPLQTNHRAVEDKLRSPLLPVGLLPTPQVAVFDERPVGQPLVAVVTCRPYRRGDDAATTIRHLGRLAGALRATHLLVFWEEADLRTSLLGPCDAHPQGLALLDALAHSFPRQYAALAYLLCWFTVGLPSTAFSLHVAVTWNARSVRMRPDGSPNDDRQHWFQRARNVPGGNEVLVLLTKWIGSRLRFGCRMLSSFSSVPHGQVSAFCAK